MGIEPDAYAEKTPDDIEKQIATSSGEIDSYLSSRYTLPLTVWPDVLRKCCAALAACDLVDTGGRDPNVDSIIDITRKRWLDWLKMVAQGTVTPDGVIDSTPGGVPAALGGGVRVQSSDSRGYSTRNTGQSRGPFQVN